MKNRIVVVALVMAFLVTNYSITDFNEYELLVSEYEIGYYIEDEGLYIHL